MSKLDTKTLWKNIQGIIHHCTQCKVFLRSPYSISSGSRTQEKKKKLYFIKMSSCHIAQIQLALKLKSDSLFDERSNLLLKWQKKAYKPFQKVAPNSHFFKLFYISKLFKICTSSPFSTSLICYGPHEQNMSSSSNRKYKKYKISRSEIREWCWNQANHWSWWGGQAM